MYNIMEDFNFILKRLGYKKCLILSDRRDSATVRKRRQIIYILTHFYTRISIAKFMGINSDFISKSLKLYNIVEDDKLLIGEMKRNKITIKKVPNYKTYKSEELV